MLICLLSNLWIRPYILDSVPHCQCQQRSKFGVSFWCALLLVWRATGVTVWIDSTDLDFRISSDHNLVCNGLDAAAASPDMIYVTGSCYKLTMTMFSANFVGDVSNVSESRLPIDWWFWFPRKIGESGFQEKSWSNICSRVQSTGVKPSEPD